MNCLHPVTSSCNYLYQSVSVSSQLHTARLLLHTTICIFKIFSLWVRSDQYTEDELCIKNQSVQSFIRGCSPAMWTLDDSNAEVTLITVMKVVGQKILKFLSRRCVDTWLRNIKPRELSNVDNNMTQYLFLIWTDKIIIIEFLNLLLDMFNIIYIQY